jgi:hypothetical protein
MVGKRYQGKGTGIVEKTKKNTGSFNSLLFPTMKPLDNKNGAE